MACWINKDTGRVDPDLVRMALAHGKQLLPHPTPRRHFAKRPGQQQQQQPLRTITNQPKDGTNKSGAKRTNATTTTQAVTDHAAMAVAKDVAWDAVGKIDVDADVEVFGDGDAVLCLADGDGDLCQLLDAHVQHGWL